MFLPISRVKTSAFLLALLVTGCAQPPEAYRVGSSAADAEPPTSSRDSNPDSTIEPAFDPITGKVVMQPSPAPGAAPNSSRGVSAQSPATSPGAGVIAQSPANGTPTQSGSTPYPAGRGANVPWTEYQAEDGKTNAMVIGPNRTRYDANHIEAEAIGRKAVRLSKTGDYVSITSRKPANSIVVRLSIPDAPTGGGINSTIGVYVNGTRIRSLPVTSRYSWVYGGEALNTPNDPGQGQAHTFFDEARALLAEIPAGAEIKLQKDA
ncbi:MAG: hypothetical protein H7249_13790, partial [Chitinophagaceae bacterium]|nr:hypothetical protein [Oligoflexus sp.]